MSLGYKHVVLTGLSGGGWVTTLAAAVDPRIKLSIPVAGTVPKWPTTLYPRVVPDLPEIDGDFEQFYARPIYKHCGFVCMYVLSQLEERRASAQILHEQDDCCYAAAGLHEEIIAYNRFVQSRSSGGAGGGWMQTYVTEGVIHQVNVRDKVIMASLIETLRQKGFVGRSDMQNMPFDLLRRDGGIVNNSTTPVRAARNNDKSNDEL